VLITEYRETNLGGQAMHSLSFQLQLSAFCVQSLSLIKLNMKLKNVC